MTDDETIVVVDETPPPVARGRLHPAAWLILISISVVALVAILLVGARYGLTSSPGRLFLEARLDGLKVGRMGRIKVEGIDGDIFDAFTVRRLTIADEKGVWLDARGVTVDWTYSALFQRRFHAQSIAARQLTLLRRPTLTPKTADRGLPVSFDIDSLGARVEMLPAFSYRRGLFDLAGELDIERRGGRSGKIVARSLLHQGDALNLDFRFGQAGAIRLVADAGEAAGGALAGALGLPADRRFALTARASGTMQEGRFNLTLLSGNTTPAKAFGGWNADGGQAAGHLDFAASRLTQGLVKRFGPSVMLAVAGRRAKDGTYAIDGRAAAQNLAVAFKGPADLKARKLTPAGLGVVARTGSIERLAGIPADGSAQVKAVLRGEWSSWTLAGTIAGSNLATDGYRLASAGGPVSLSRRKGEWLLTSALTGAGGQGSGYVAAILGARPTASIEASRLPDRRMLLRRVTARGPGLKLDAKGERGLLGGLSFKGDAEFSNLAAARKGASGVVRAGWSASRASLDRPWAFTVDAKGGKFAAGLAELDRLLGPAPRLRVRANYGRGRIEVAEGRLDGASASARAAGVLADGKLGFKLDWDAKGPFRAGPVEIAGDARGDGSVTGSLAAPRADLTASFDAIDLPRLPLTDAKVTLSFLRGEGGTNGQFALAADSAYGPARANTAFRFAPGGVDLTDLDADAGGVKAQGALSLRRGQPSTADLTLAIGPGAVLTEGQIAGAVKIADAAGGARAVLDLTATNATVRGAGRLSIGSAAIAANGPLARLPLTIKASGEAAPGNWRIDGTGMLASADGYALTLDASGRLGRADFRTLEPAVLRIDGPERSARLRLALGRGKADLDARLDGDGADVTAVLADVALGTFNEDAAGSIDARATLQGRGERLTGMLDATLKDARGRGAPRELSLDGVVKARLEDSELAIDGAATNSQGLRSSVGLVLPVEASAAPLRLAVAMRRPVRGRFAADGEIGPLWNLFIGEERSLSGKVAAEGTLSGTLADPRASGQASLAGGRFEDGATGLELRDLALAASFQGEAVDVSALTANDGNGGKLSGAGRISLEREGVSNFRLDLTRFQLIDNDTATATASGKATINRDAAGRVQLTGALTIDRADIAADPPTPSGVVSMDVIEINKPGGSQRGLQAEASRGLAVALDVTLTAPRRIFVEGRGLNAELSLDAHVGGTTRDPALTGTARIVRGEYDFAGKRFEFDDRGVVYLAADPERIRLDLTATRDDPTLTAVIRVRGTAARPEIVLTSSPALPSDEVLSQVLFGASASQLSPLEAAQLASALAALAGGGGFDVIGGLRGLTRLDRLAFAGGGEGGVTVAGGKYLTDDVYLEIIGGGREGPAAQVEWRVRRTLAIVSRIASQGDARLSVRWRRDY